MSIQTPEPCPAPLVDSIFIAIDDNLTFGNWNGFTMLPDLPDLPDLPSSLTPLFCNGSSISTLPDLPLTLHTLYEDQPTPPPPSTALHTPPIEQPTTYYPKYCPPVPRGNRVNPANYRKQQRIEARQQNSKEAKRRRADAGLSDTQLAKKYCPNRDWQCGCWREGGC